jgi:hypothetical protein
VLSPWANGWRAAPPGVRIGALAIVAFVLLMLGVLR